MTAVPTEKCYNCGKKFEIGDSAFLQRRQKISTKGNAATFELIDVAVCGDCR